MGLSNCKSLFTKSKTQHSVNNGNNVNHDKGQPATASDYQVSTIQDAVVSIGKAYVTAAFFKKTIMELFMIKTSLRVLDKN